VIATYTKGRWSAFISPTAALHVPLAPMDGDAEHMVTCICEGHPTLALQRMIGWNARGMWMDAMDYVNERNADDKEKTNDEG
jgi:hypothetical protein